MKWRIADLFCGAGGASKGLHDAGFEVVGFDNRPQPRYPYEFRQVDVFDVDLSEFDAVWASPPCQAYVSFRHNQTKTKEHWDSVPPTREKLVTAGIPYIIENVPGAPLQNWAMLCGTMFGLGVLRHRWFECSFGIPFPPFTCAHQGCVTHGDYAAVYGHSARGPRRGRDPWGKKLRDPKPDKDGPEWSEAMGIDWMTKAELTQAVPPAYSEFLGQHLINCVRAK